MYIVLTGGAGRITKPLAMKLLKEGHAVIIITRNADHIAELTDPEMGGIAAVGSIEDADFLTKTFTDAEAVYTMVPPDFDKEGLNDWKKQGEIYATAIRNSGVKRVVNLSSIGAHLPEGAGPVSGLYYVEQELNKLADVAVTHVQAGYLYYNFLELTDMVKHMNMIGENYGGEGYTLAMVDATDVADVIADELTSHHTAGIGATGVSDAITEEMKEPQAGEHTIRYAVSDEKTTDEIATTLGSAVGKPDLKWTVFTDEQAVQGMVQGGVPQKMAESLAEMGHSMQTGKMTEVYRQKKPAITGKVKLEDFAQEQFAPKYNGGK